MAPTEGRVAGPEWPWDLLPVCAHSRNARHFGDNLPRQSLDWCKTIQNLTQKHISNERKWL